MDNNVTETPERWVILKINGPEPYFRVFAGWRGGYLDGDSWRMNSGIVGVEEDEEYYYFEGHSGSWYKCHKNGYGFKEGMCGFSPYVQSTLELVIEKSPVPIEILDEETDFTGTLLKIKLANVTMTKTKKCDWCNKRKKVSDMYRLGKLKETDKKEYWICSKCNLKHDVC